MKLAGSLGRAPLSGDADSPAELDLARGRVLLFDQRAAVASYVSAETPDQIVDAIRAGVVRGDAAVGLAAAYALVLLARGEHGDGRAFLLGNGVAGRILSGTRPGAPSVQRALSRLSRAAALVAARSPDERCEAMAAEASALHVDTVAACRALAERALLELPSDATIVTMGHTGGLATGGYGTALGLARAAQAAGRAARVLLVDPRGTGALDVALARYELEASGIDSEAVEIGDALAVEGAVVVLAAERVALDGASLAAAGARTLAEQAAAARVPLRWVSLTGLIDREAPSGAALPSDEGREVVPADVIGELTLER